MSREIIQKKYNELKVLLGRSQFLIAPVLIGLFPILSLYERNIHDVPGASTVQPILMVIGATLLGGLIFRFITKNFLKIGVLLCLIWLFFYMYVPITDLVAKWQPLVANYDSFLLPLWILVLLGIILYILKWSKSSYKLALDFLTVVGVVLFGMQVFGLMTFSRKPPVSDQFKYLVNNEDKTLFASKQTKLPDIYYILLDGYPRSDTLKQYFNYDNSSFDNYLESNNFFIANKSHTNYSQTSLAMPAILNMSYLKDVKPKGITRTELLETYNNNKVLHYLKAAGYGWVNNNNFSRAGTNPYADLNIFCTKSNEFLKELINTTVLKPVNPFLGQQRKDLWHESRCVLDNMSKDLSGPHFTFSHLLAPHPPYVFNADGSESSSINLGVGSVERWLEKEPFIDQLKYVNKRVSEQIDIILNRSPEAIIIVQSDHGTLSSATDPNAKGLHDSRDIVLVERSRNLLAIHLPDFCDKSKLYDSITGVNTFRVVLNSCFNAGYGILEDKMYYNDSPPEGYTGFRDITNIVKD